MQNSILKLNPAIEQTKRLQRLRFSDRKYKYLTEPTRADRVLAATLLRLISLSVRPNLLTILRFVSVPFILWFLIMEKNAYALILFTLSAFSDAIDGALARTRHQITGWGIVADPIADKLLIGSVAAVAITKYLGIYLTATIIGIEIVLVAFSFFRYRGKLVPARTVGKVKMILQCIGVGLILLYAAFPAASLLIAAEYTLYAAVAFALLSLFVYRSI